MGRSFKLYNKEVGFLPVNAAHQSRWTEWGSADGRSSAVQMHETDLQDARDVTNPSIDSLLSRTGI